jgi:hypothetical protein
MVPVIYKTGSGHFMLKSTGWDYVSELQIRKGLLFIPQNMVSHGVRILTGEKEEFGEKPAPVPLCPPQIPHGVIGARTRASEVRSRRLTAWAMSSRRLVFLFCFAYTELWWVRQSGRENWLLVSSIVRKVNQWYRYYLRLFRCGTEGK